MKKFNLSAKDIAALGISGTSLGISAANYKINKTRQKEAGEYQKKQLEAMNRLTETMKRVDSSMRNYEKARLASPEEPPKKTKKRFLPKIFSKTLDYAIKGGALGGTVAGGVIPFLPRNIGMTRVPEPERDNSGKIIYKDGKPKMKDVWYDDPGFKHPKFKEKYNSKDPIIRNALIEVGGIAIGATLGALAGAIADISNAIHKKTTINRRLMKDILVNLKKMGFQEGRDYTRDPKVSSLLKTKVCLVVSKSSDELRLLINTVNDYKLKSITEKITGNLPTMSTVTEKVSDRFNEINITTMTSNNGDAIWIASLAEKFIKEGFPVYLVEVG